MAITSHNLRRRSSVPAPTLTISGARKSLMGSGRSPTRLSSALTPTSAAIIQDLDCSHPRSDETPIGLRTPGASSNIRPTSRRRRSLTPLPPVDSNENVLIHNALLDMLNGRQPARVDRDSIQLRKHHLPRPAGGGFPTASQDSHPGPLMILGKSEPSGSRCEEDRRLAHEQLIREFESTLVPAPTERRYAVQEQTPHRSHAARGPQIGMQSSVREARGSDFPDGGLDLGVDDDDSNDGHLHGSQMAGLQVCNQTVNRLEEHISLQRIEHDQQMENMHQRLEEAETDADHLAVELQEREDTIVALQQRFNESNSRAHQTQGEDTELVTDTSQQHLAHIDSLTEQLHEANAMIDSLKAQLAASNRTMAYLHNGLDDNKLKEQLEDCNTHREESNRELADSRKTLAAHAAYMRQRDAAIQAKEDRLDSLWNALRNLSGNESTADEVEILRARIKYLESLENNVHEQINSTDETENVEHREDTESGHHEVGHEQEIDQYKNQIAQLSTMIDTLNRQLHDCRSSNERVQQQTTQIEEEVASEEGSTHSSEGMEMEASLLAQIKLLDTHVADAYRRLRESLATNKILGQLIEQIEQRRVLDEEAEEIARERLGDIANLLGDARADRADRENELAELHDALQAAQEDIARLQDDNDVDVHYNDSSTNDDSGFVEAGTSIESDELPHAPHFRSSRSESENSGFVEGGTPIEPDELPRAKRLRSSPPEVDAEYIGESGDEDLDHLVSPSSFMESEPSPLLPRLRRNGRTRRQSERLSSSQHGYGFEDDEQAQLPRDLATVAPPDPGGLAVVVDRGEYARAIGNVGKGNGSKRKRN